MNHTDTKSRLPEWKVYSDGNFCGKCPGMRNGEHAGTELAIGKQFLWDGEEWLIPSVYLCSKALVIDFLQKVPAERIRQFIDKWQLGPGRADDTDFSSEQRLLIDADNPLTFHPLTKAQVNGRTIPHSHSIGICWNPVFSPADTLEARMVLEHYRLDASRGWVIWRSCFPWNTRRKPRLKNLSVHLSAEKKAVPGPHFHTNTSGSKFTFLYPADKTKHTLTVIEYHTRHIDSSHFPNPAKEYPGWFIIMGFTITPALPKGCLSLADCCDSDKPRLLPAGRQSAQAAESAAAIIGGADGPTSLCFSEPEHPEMLYAVSASHFEPVMDVDWRMIYHEQRRSDICIELLP